MRKTSFSALTRLLVTLGILVLLSTLGRAMAAQFPTHDLIRAIPEETTPKQIVERAWLLARLAGTYDFASEIEQTTLSPPMLTNVGRPARTETVYLEGRVDAENGAFQLAFWQGGSVLNRNDAFQVRVEDGRVYGRAFGEEWKEMDTDASAFTGLFAPGKDPLSFLNAMRNLRETTDAQDMAASGVRQFHFQIDGPALAEYVRQELENEMRRSGKLPASLTLETPRIYRDAVGTGDLWISKDGVPRRLEIALAFPQQVDGTRTTATIRTDFSNFARVEPGSKETTALFRFIHGSRIPLFLSNMVARLALVDWPMLAGQLLLTLLGGVSALALATFGRRVRAYAVVTVATLMIMIGGPLIEASRVYAFYDEQVAAQKKYEAELAQKQQEDALLTPAWDPGQPPLAVAEAKAVLDEQLNVNAAHVVLGNGNDVLETQATDLDGDSVPDAQEPQQCRNSLDCDQDGLTDLQESRLGTRLDNADSDGDGLRDDMEVKGFGSTGKTPTGKWYSDPLNADTNLDGLADTVECWQDETFTRAQIQLVSNIPCDRDTDGDGVPDIFEIDNDGDGVDDSSDLSPFVASTEVYTEEHPFVFQVDGLTPNKPLFVDFQLVPLNPKQISYAGNVLDWPSGDTVGQVQRTENTTFASGKPAGTYSPSDENGDMRLVPLVEIRIPADDASNLLPVTQNMVITRTVTGYESVKTGSGTNAKETLQVWLYATIQFRAHNGQTEIVFTQVNDKDHSAQSIARARIYQTTACPVAITDTPIYEVTSLSAGSTWSLSALPLPDLLDGQHVMVLEKGDGKTATCVPLGDIPNGLLPKGKMFDTDRLSAYGIILRDRVEKEEKDSTSTQKVTHVVAYLPAQVVTGRTGGEKQAFMARMPYWLRNNVTSLGGAQEVRLVWMIQLLNDDDNIQIIHTYTNEPWKLAGLEARQDIEVRSAVFYQNPDSVYNQDTHIQALHSRLIQLAEVLSVNMVAGSLKRLTLNASLLSTLENQYQFPAGSLGMVFQTYQTQDEVARIPAEVNPQVLQHFVDGNGALKAGYTHALLLYAREEEYKSSIWMNPNAQNVKLTLPAETSTLVSLNWKPFRYGASGWTPYPLREYLDLYFVHLKDAIRSSNPPSIQNAGSDREAAIDGMALLGQAFALGMVFGQNSLVRVNGKFISSTPVNLDPRINTIGKDVVGSTLQLLTEQILQDWLEQSTLLASAGGTGGQLAALGNVLKGKVAPFLKQKDAQGNPIKVPRSQKVQAGISLGVTALSVAAIGLNIGKLISSDSKVQDALDATINSMSVISSIVNTTNAVKGASEAIKASGSLQAAMQSAGAVSRAAKIAGIVGIVLSVAIPIGIFVGQWAAGNLGITDLAFTATLANVIASVIVALIMVAIAAIPIVGQIIAAVIALIDALIAGVCAISKAAGFDLEKASTLNIPRTNSKLSFCAGITGFLTESVKFFIFNQNVLVGNMTAKDRLRISNLQFGFGNMAHGFQVGNTLQPSLRVDNQIKLIDQPIDWKSALYFWQINWDNLDEATYRYDITTKKEHRDVDLGEMESEWQELRNGKLTGEHRSPGIQYDDPLVMVPAIATLAENENIKLEKAGLNVPVQIYLRESYANPAQECFVLPLFPILVPIPTPVCYIREQDGANHINLNLKFDIFPASLDKFYQPIAKDAGYSLAWGQEGSVTFPVMRDFDGDGLLSVAFGGNDPDDSLWDTDGDGLSDLFEIQHGMQPTLLDSDGDGLSDRQEVWFGTDPTQRDSDGDGLVDGEEVFHENVDGNWRGGWEFVYDLVDGGQLATWVSSDPSQLDGDADTLTDYQEKLYGLHPEVTSNPHFLSLESQVRETNAPLALLRFEERAGANMFGDQSGFFHNATCDGNHCPAAGHAGKYTNALVFDGVDDYVRIEDDVSLTQRSFTVAFWAKRADSAANDQFIFSAGEGALNKGLHIGFRNNQFMCAFWLNDLSTTETYPDTEWHHWACAYDMQTGKRTIYRDGVVVARDRTNVSAYQGSGDWFLGARFDQVGFFNGMVDELLVFPVALNAEEVQAAMQARYNPGGTQVVVAPGDSLTYGATLTNNLLGRNLRGLLSTDVPENVSDGTLAPVPFMLGPGGKTTLTGNFSVASTAQSGTYTLTLTSGASADDPRAASNYAALYLPFDNNLQDASGWQPPRNVALKGGNAIFESNAIKGYSVNLSHGRYVEIPKAVVNSADFTFAAWIYWQGGGAWQRIFDFGENTTKYLFLTPSNFDGKTLFAITDKGGQGEQKLSTDPLPQNQWVHVAVTLKDDLGILYINGVEKSRGAITLNPSDVVGNNNWLGKSQYNEDPMFNGLIDEVYIFNRALSQAEIGALATVPSVHFTFDETLTYGMGQSAALKYGHIQYGFGVANSPGLHLDGQTVYEANDGVFKNDKAFTYALWIYPESDQGVQAVFGQPLASSRLWNKNGGVYLFVRNGRDLQFGWGDYWKIDWIPGVLQFKAWNHIVITSDGATVKVYVNGVEKAQKSYGDEKPPALVHFSIGDNNYCAEFDFKNAYTVKEGDPGSDSAEYVYDFIDENNNTFRILYDGDADTREWEPGNGPQRGEWFNDKKYTFCGVGARVHVWEDDVTTSDDQMGPDLRLYWWMPDKSGMNGKNYESFRSHDIDGDGTVRFYYEIHNPAVPFNGYLDDFRIYRRSFTGEEVAQLYDAYKRPYYFTLDDPPGAGLNGVFNFQNEGGIRQVAAHGVCDGASCPVSGLPGRINQAAQFNGAQSITTQSPLFLKDTTAYAAWVFPHGTLSGEILRHGDIRLFLENGSLCYQHRGGNVCSSEAVATNQWVHTALIIQPFSTDSYQISLYQDGREVTKSSYTGTYMVNEKLTIGDGFQGILDDIQITTDAAIALSAQTRAPVVSLHFQERDPNTNIFENMAGEAATCSGTACPHAGMEGKVGYAVRFDGVDDGLLIPDTSQLDLQSFTVAAWVKPRAGVTGWQPLVAKAVGDFRNYALYLKTERKVYVTRYCGNYLLELTSTRPLPLDQYTHLAATYDGKTLSLYINGQLDSQVSTSGNVPSCYNDAPLALGKPYNASSFYKHFSGDLDEVQIYNYALQSYEIKKLFDVQSNWIEDEDDYAITVDADIPTSRLSENWGSAVYYANADVQLGAVAQDTTTMVTLLELGVSRNGGPTVWTAAEACQDAAGETKTGSSAWCPWFKPTSMGGEGRYVVQTRATDAVGNRETPATTYTIFVDATGPTLTVDQPNGSLQTLIPSMTQPAMQVLPLRGTVDDPALSSGDPGSGVSEVWVTMRNADGQIVGEAPYQALLDGTTWTLEYPFSQEQVAGTYSLEVIARDKVGNETTLPTYQFILDGTAPGVELDEVASGLPLTQTTTVFITQGTTLRGIVSERPFPRRPEVGYHFEESAGATSFANAVASSGWRDAGHAICSGATCPTSGTAGKLGNGLDFDGVDDYLNLPADVAQTDDFTFAGWFYWRGGGDWQRIFDFGQNTTKYLFLTPRGNTGQMRFAISEGGIFGEQQLNTDALPTNQWVHVAVTLQGDTGVLYINGEEKDRQTITINPSQVVGNNNWLGKSQFWGGPWYDPSFNGMMDEVVIYHRALSADEIRVLAASQVSGVASVSVAFTPLWADERSGTHSPHVSPPFADDLTQVLHLPLDDASDKQQNTLYRNLALKETAEQATCRSLSCPAIGERSPGGGSARFDGKDDYISLPNSVAQTNDFTFAAWVYWQGGTPGQHIFDFGQSGNQNLFLTPSSPNGQTEFGINNQQDSQKLQTTALPVNQWVHVAVTLQGDTGVLYINGVEKDRQPMTLDPVQVAGDNNWLGRSQGGGAPYFNGMLSDVHVFHRALSQSEIETLWRGSRALLALPFDEPFATHGTPLRDTSGWQHTISLNAGDGDTTNKAIPGITGPYALSFDGVNDSIVLPEVVPLANRSFSVAFWAKHTDQNEDQWAFSAGTNLTNHGLLIGFRPGNYFTCGFFLNDVTTPTPVDENWHHWVCTYDVETGKRTLYQDGVQVAQDIPIGGVHYQGSGDWYIGRAAWEGVRFKGALDDLRVYARVLDPAEIADLANAGWRTVVVSGEQSAWSLPVPAGLEGLYRLDLRATDTAGRQSFNSQEVPINQIIDSKPPRVTAVLDTAGKWRETTRYQFSAEDLFIQQSSLSTPCGTDAAVYTTLRKDFASGKSITSGLDLSCTFDTSPSDTTSRVCDVAGNCTTVGTTTTTTTTTSREAMTFARRIAPLRFVEPHSIRAATTTIIAPGGFDSSIALNSSGTPVIAYWDDVNGYLNLAICNDATCASGAVTTTIDTGNVGFGLALTLNASDIPIVSYFDSANNALKVAVCGNATCTSGNVITTVDTGGVGMDTDIALNANGYPVISYYDWVNQDLKVAICGDAICSSGNTLVSLDSAGDVGRYTSLALNSSGAPVVSYYDNSNSALKVAVCGDALCSMGNVTSLVDTGGVGEYTSLVLDANDNPIISYYDATNGDLKVAICSTADCTGGVISRTLDSANDVGMYTSLALNSSGLPVIAYHDATHQDLRVAVCEDATCSTSLTATVESLGGVGVNPSLVLNSNDQPLISHHELGGQVLRFAVCQTANCRPDTQIDSAPPNVTSSTIATFAFSSTDVGATFECQLDGGGFSICTSPETYSDLNAGTHTFAVRAIDSLGNYDPTPATYTWTIDLALEPGTFEFVDMPSVVTTTQPIQIHGRVVPPNSLTGLMVTVGQTLILTETYPAGTVTSRDFIVDWTPPQEGTYLVTAVATDALSGTNTISTTLFVETGTPPNVIISQSIFTSTDYSPARGIVFSGIVTDATGVVDATARFILGSDIMTLPVTLDEGSTPAGYLNGVAVYTQTSGYATWSVLNNLPDNRAGTLDIVLTDVSLTPVTYTFPVTLDLVTPSVGEITVLANGAPMTASATYATSRLTTSVTIPPVSDGGGVTLWYGWTERDTASLSDLTQASDPTAPMTVTQVFTRTMRDGGVSRFFHLRAIDGFGNTRSVVFGPYYQDLSGMPDYASLPLSTYRGWLSNGCTLLGTDQRIAAQSGQDAALSDAQSLYLTWDDAQLHLVWSGADWNTDGDLFIYLDTIPDQPYQEVGSHAAYNPYTRTAASTVLLLPTEEWSNDPAFVPPAGAPPVNGMHADYALWVQDRAIARLLRWDNAGRQWVDDGNLNDLGGSYEWYQDVDGTYTDLIVPLGLIGNPQNWVEPFPGLGPEGMGLVAFAVDAAEGPSGGLRLWSVLPYANPVDSERVVSGAPSPDEPHRMMLTDRYVVPMVDGACFQPEANLEFFLTADVDSFDFNPTDGRIRLIVPELSISPEVRDSLFAPYDDTYRDWLINDYCPTHPTFSECRLTKPPTELSEAERLASLIDATHPPLLPGTPVTYTLYYLNPSASVVTKTAYLYSNGDLYAPQSGVVFDGQTWAGGCPGWLSLNLQPGIGAFVFTGTVQASGVNTVTLDIEPAYHADVGCGLTGNVDSLPDIRLQATHTPDDGAPAFVAIQSDLSTSGPISTTISGLVRDAAPVSLIEIEVTSPQQGTTSFVCTDPTPTDGQWACLWDIPATNGGIPPSDGDTFTLRARATDAFGNTSDWSWPQVVLIDASAPQFGVENVGTSGTTTFALNSTSQTNLTATLVSDSIVRFTGVISDNTVPQSVQVCDASGQTCENAQVTIDPFDIPPTRYEYAAASPSPVMIDVENVCGAGTLGVEVTFPISDSFTVSGLDVGIRVAHPYRSDLFAYLQSPSGTRALLFSFTKNRLAENITALFTETSLDRLEEDNANHALEDDYFTHVYRPQERLSVFNGESAAGTWTLTLCDRDPASDTGAFYDARLYFRAVAPPLHITGSWEYTVDVSGNDGEVYTWQIFSTDMHGNQTTLPYNLSVEVDNVPPVVTATQSMTRGMVFASTPVLAGTASDGDEVERIWVVVTEPSGATSVESVAGNMNGWTYTFTPSQSGEYSFIVYAADRAGNLTSDGPFTFTAIQPLDIIQTVEPQSNVKADMLVTYTLVVANSNADEPAQNVVITSTLSQWLTPVQTSGASYADNMLTWSFDSIDAGTFITLTTVARAPDSLWITATLPITDWIDLHGEVISSTAGVTTDNLGDSQAYPTSFSFEPPYEPTTPPIIDFRKHVTLPPTVVSTDTISLGSVVTYTLYVTNTSTVTSVVTLSDTLSLALSPKEIGGAIYDEARHTLVWPTQTLLPSESITLTFSARLTTDQSIVDDLQGYIANQAILSSTLGVATSNEVGFYAPTTPPSPQIVYIPLVLNGGHVSQTMSLTVEPLLGPIPAVPTRSISATGETFYTQTLIVQGAVPQDGVFYFSSAPHSVEPIFIENELILKHQERDIFSVAMKEPKIVEVPRSVVEIMAANEVLLEYRGYEDGQVGASEVWLVWTSNRERIAR